MKKGRATLSAKQNLIVGLNRLKASDKTTIAPNSVIYAFITYNLGFRIAEEVLTTSEILNIAWLRYPLFAEIYERILEKRAIQPNIENFSLNSTDSA